MRCDHGARLDGDKLLFAFRLSFLIRRVVGHITWARAQHKSPIALPVTVPLQRLLRSEVVQLIVQFADGEFALVYVKLPASTGRSARVLYCSTT